MSTHGPIPAEQRKFHNDLARSIDEILNGKPPRQKVIAFVLLTANFGSIDHGRVNYISNGARAEIVAMLNELLARFEGRHAEEMPAGAPQGVQ